MNSNWVVSRRLPEGGTSRSIPVRASSPIGAASQALEILGEGQGTHVMLVYSSLGTGGGDGKRYVVRISVELG